jgi:hypothetical protein
LRLIILIAIASLQTACTARRSAPQTVKSLEVLQAVPIHEIELGFGQGFHENIICDLQELESINKIVIAVNQGTKLEAWDLATKQKSGSFDGGIGNLQHEKFLPSRPEGDCSIGVSESRRFLAYEDAQGLKIYDLLKRKVHFTLPSKYKHFLSASFTADDVYFIGSTYGSRLFHPSYGPDYKSSVLMIDMETGEELVAFTEPENDVVTVKYFPSKKALGILYGDSVLKFYSPLKKEFIYEVDLSDKGYGNGAGQFFVVGATW